VHGEVQLRVVGVLVVPHAVPLDDIDTPLQLLTDLPPLQHGDLTFYYEHIHVPVYTVQYNRQFLKYRHFKYIIP